MPDGIELAKAYVQIVPSAQGIKSSLTEIFDEETDGLGERTGQSIGEKLVGTIKKVAAAAGIGKIISDSINVGGALQQSLGGIETLFKDSADTVKAYAAQAYKTAGLSANDYMEATTSFAASLLSSLGGDTARAAEAANQAMVDMSDNANKMGTNMQDIQNAYQGFAKQNYTMLDNLKIGYGGTQAEMQRLLEDAEKISGVHYELGNLADMYSAIHVIQQELDITGTTAKEASTTLTGSFSSMAAAFKNTLGSIALGEDLAPSLEALVETTRTYLVDNLLPMAVNVVRGIPEALMTLIPDFIAEGTELIRSIGSGFTEGVPELLANALPALLSFSEELRANLGEFVDAGIDLVLNLAQGIVQSLPDLFAYIPDIVINIAGLINDNAPKLLAGGAQLIVMLGKGILQSIPLLIQNAGKIVEAVLAVISAFNWVNLGANILKGIANGVKSMGTSLLNAFKSGFSGALSWIKSLPAQAVKWGKDLIQNFISGLTGTQGAATAATAATAVASKAAAKSSKSDVSWSLSDEVADKAEVNALVMQNAAKKTASAMAASSGAASKAATSAASASKAMAASSGAASKAATSAASASKATAKAAKETAATVVSSVKQSSTQLLNGVQTVTETTREVLSDGTSQMKQTITETQDQIVDGALKTVETIRTIAADGAVTTAQTVKESSAASFSGLWKEIQNEADKGVQGTFDTLVNAVKKQDWASVGQWLVSTLYNGLDDSKKLKLENFALDLVRQLNGALGNAVGQLSATAWSLGGEIVNGITGGFGEILNQAGILGESLSATFNGLKAPLAASAQAISAGLSGGLLSSLPTIYAGFAGMVGTIGAAVEAMLASVSAALSATVFGIPAGVVVAAAAVALGVTIAAICAKLGSSKPASSSAPKPGTGGGGSSSASSAVFDTGALLWDYEKSSAEPARKPRPRVEVNQYIYSKAQTAADLMRETQYEQERAVLQGV